MEGRDLIGLLVGQVGLQNVGEQVVVAVPAAGPVERVIYDENDWAPASLRMEFRGHSVILEPSNNTINTVTVTGKKFGTLVLLVVPPESTHAAAHTAAMTAADRHE